MFQKLNLFKKDFMLKWSLILYISGPDGKLHCKCCKRSFTKERFFVTHKCLAVSDYVDITKKGAMGK